MFMPPVVTRRSSNPSHSGIHPGTHCVVPACPASVFLKIVMVPWCFAPVTGEVCPVRQGAGGEAMQVDAFNGPGHDDQPTIRALDVGAGSGDTPDRELRWACWGSLRMEMLRSKPRTLVLSTL